MIFLKEGRIKKILRGIQQKFGIGFLSADFWKDFRKKILWIEELVQADTEHLPSKKIKTLFENLVYLQEDNSGSHMLPREVE